jgi:glycerol-3-phosphate dehydrogenase
VRYGTRVDDVADACGRIQEGRRALGADTLAGEVEWAVRHDDCLTAEDFLFRRTDLGLEARDVAEAAVDLVLERMANALAWPADRVDAERAAVRAAIAERHLWRDADD